MKHLVSTAVAAALVAGAAPLRADVISFQHGVSPTGTYAHHDAQVRNDAANANTPSNTSINVVGWTGGANPVTLRAIHSWDLSAIPANATINSVTLTVGNRSDTGVSIDDGNNTVDASDPLVELRTISTTFNETTATWNNTFGAGMTLGGTVLSSAYFDPEIGSGFNYSVFVSTAAFVAAVQAAVDDPSNLFNFALVLANESGSNRIAIQTGGNSANDPSVPNRPILTIDYTPVPEPATATLLLTAAALLVRPSRAPFPR